MFNIMVLAAATFILSSCTFRNAPEITKIRSLSNTIIVSEKDDMSGEILGLERQSLQNGGKIKANVLIVHGMGWSQTAEGDDTYGLDFIKAMESAYGVKGTIGKIKRLCPQFRQNGNSDTRFSVGGMSIFAEAGTAPFTTDAPLTTVNITKIACLDRISIDLNKKGVINVYRLFWDDPFYNAFEYRLLGYDDNIFKGQEMDQSGDKGYENIDANRASLNAKLKQSVVTYGFSDATLYLGPAGRQIRAALRGGICAVVNEITGQSKFFDDDEAKIIPTKSGGPPVSKLTNEIEICSVKTGFKPAPLTIITKSLSSRIMFDTLTSDKTRLFSEKLSQLSNKELEVFMFANQIPLLALGKLHDEQPLSRLPTTQDVKVRFVAVSEINDLLSYEIVPYFEHLYYMRCSPGLDCDVPNTRVRMKNLRTNIKVRDAYIKELGFEAIDVRARFASNIVPLVPFVHPLIAHGGHITAIPVRNLFLCGAHEGRLRKEGCMADATVD